ncbi:hypothetical protein GCM10028806_02060 [Spirosoma terrae]|nr:hypothetical protein [Spirosoma terrae]
MDVESSEFLDFVAIANRNRVNYILIEIIDEVKKRNEARDN